MMARVATVVAERRCAAETRELERGATEGNFGRRVAHSGGRRLYVA